MCGLSGFWSPKSNFSEDRLEKLALHMSIPLTPRGPDGSGVWVDAAHQIAFSHRRLAILDLSPAGVQPMASRSGRFIITYNGEVFNSTDLQAALQEKGATFRGHSDTEVIVEAVEAWGVQGTVEKLIGMFAFALWDKQEETLYLVRDRLGIKPLYWGYQKNTLMFGSTVSSLKAHPSMEKRLNEEALKAYMLYQYVPAPLSIYKDIHKLRPGHMGIFRKDHSPLIKPYWSLENVIQEARQTPFNGSEGEAVQALEELLKDVIKRRMLADVPLGAFLSGGVDSSLVVALMQAQSSAPVKTFSIGFELSQFNEAPYAKAVASHIGTDHHEMYFSMKEASSLVSCIVDWYDEPFADSSQLPTYLVSKIAREKVTVALSGDGGDELFAGYNRYHMGWNYWKYLQQVPFFLRKSLAFCLHKTPTKMWEIINQCVPSLPHSLAIRRQKFAQILQVNTLLDYYQSLIRTEGSAFDYLRMPSSLPPSFAPHPALQHPIEQMQYWDTLTYLPDDILTKVDRASMAVSLEARVPLLDHRLVDFAWRLPLHMKIRNGQGKWALRQVLYKYVPASLIERPKMGFGIPLEAWLKNDLRPWADHLLSMESLKENPILDPHKVHQLWKDFLANKYNEVYFLWMLIMMQEWLQKNA